MRLIVVVVVILIVEDAAGVAVIKVESAIPVTIFSNVVVKQGLSHVVVKWPMKVLQGRRRTSAAGRARRSIRIARKFASN